MKPMAGSGVSVGVYGPLDRRQLIRPNEGNSSNERRLTPNSIPIYVWRWRRFPLRRTASSAYASAMLRHGGNWSVRRQLFRGVVGGRPARVRGYVPCIAGERSEAQAASARLQYTPGWPRLP